MLEMVDNFEHLVLQPEHTSLVKLLCVGDYISTWAWGRTPPVVSLANLL
jgi:hypothetical protein